MRTLGLYSKPLVGDKPTSVKPNVTGKGSRDLRGTQEIAT